MSIEEGQVEEGQVEDEGSDDDFLAGIDGGSTETPSQQEPAKVETPVEPEQQPTEAAASVAAPEFVQITKADWEAMQSRAAAIDDLRAAQEKLAGTAFGKIGDLQRQLKESRAGSTLAEEDFADIKENYPELADTLQKLLSKMPAGPASGIDLETVEKLLDSREERTRYELRLESLEAAQPKWEQDVKTESFKEWMYSRPNWKPQYADKAYQAVVLNDPNSELNKFIQANPDDPVAQYFSPRISDAAMLVGAFRKDKSAVTVQKPVATPSARKQQLAAAATPKSSGARAPTRTEDDDFLAGLNSRR